MNELIGQLVKQLGVQEAQAKGGAGLLFKLAQSKPPLPSPPRRGPWRA
ncbi:MAG: DUF2780 domain-containing protein [Kiritimatiellae bacterium]|nr:DUF2780 domain-containing protein [Kiritimatiellia bacterium]